MRLLSFIWQLMRCAGTCIAGILWAAYGLLFAVQSLVLESEEPAAQVFNVIFGLFIAAPGVVLWGYSIKWLKEEIAYYKRNQQLEKQKKQQKKRTADMTTLLDRYAATVNPSAEETESAWVECNDRLREITSDKPVNGLFLIFDSSNEIKFPMLSEDWIKNEEIRLKLWDFYYRIAYAYCLNLVEQCNLLRYLTDCFRRYDCPDSFPDYNDVYGPKYHGLPYEIEEWNEKLLKLLEKGCKKDNAAALSCLAWCYYKKVAVDLRDYDKAFALYQQAAQLGDIHSVYMLGKCYENGHGTKRNPQKAGDCYQYAYDLSKDKRYADALDKLYTAQKWDKNRYSPDIFVNNTAVLKKDNLEAIREKLEKYARTDLATAELRVLAVSVGMLQEDVVNSYISCFERSARDDEMYQKIDLLRNKDYFTKEIADKAHFVRKLRNHAAHEGNQNEPITVENVRTQILYVQDIVEYYAAY